MRKFLNTLFIVSEESYLGLDGENVLVLSSDKDPVRFPLHTLENIMSFSYKGASPALIGECTKRGISVSFFSPSSNRFLGSVNGDFRGNVLLRKTHYRLSEDSEYSLSLSKQFMIGKIFNSRLVIERALRDHPLRVDTEELRKVSVLLKGQLQAIPNCDSMDKMRGLEGNCASWYFSVFDQLILQNKDDFFFHERTRRPPMDNVNALLSFFYSILANDCASALEGVGLDPYVGFMHVDRPGRRSLALDLMEELRSIIVDRFVLTLINNKVINSNHFNQFENRSVTLNETGRKITLSSWQKRKQEIIFHPFLEEKIPRGLLPFSQALLLARYLRGDIDAYPPYLGV